MGLSSVAVIAQGAPVVVETLFNHYFKHKKTVKDSTARSELLYDEAFSVMKAFLEIATKNTVEDLQRFSNAHMPSPPSVLVVPLLIPLSTCRLAADHLVRAFGGADEARRVVGGTEWWRVRGLKGVEAEWIVGKRLWAEREKEEKRRESATHGQKGKAKADGASTADAGLDPDEEADLDEQMAKEGMDDMQRTMLYIHGGAYYWGSINTHRYTIWRYARKMKGRAFAVNYRKAPQYPFPCALQDALAAYLYLLYPPAEAKHKAIEPAQIVVAGDSAGGGLTLALLMVLRDAGLPLPAGAIAISPWCDLTHSFPSTMDNFATDVMPPYGFIHKPSTLWPPPAAELSEHVQQTLRERVRQAVDRMTARGDDTASASSAGSSDSEVDDEDDDFDVSASAASRTNPAATTTAKGDSINLDTCTAAVKGDNSTSVHNTFVGTDGLSKSEASRKLNPRTEGGKDEEGERPPATETAERPHQNAVDPTDGKDLVIVIDGKQQTIRGQIQHLAENRLLPHPYVSPAFGYLGGLCPLLVLASDKELLRDEIMYTAHKAAHPDKYPIPSHVIKLMPHLKDINERFEPTQVHLQVYDEVCHVLPLYSMTTPAKYAYRSIANFCKFVTSPQTRPPSPNSLSPAVSAAGDSPVPSLPGTPDGRTESEELGPKLVFTEKHLTATPAPSIQTSALEGLPPLSPLSPLDSDDGRKTPRSAGGSKSSSNGGRRRWLTVDGSSRAGSGDVAGPRFQDPTEPPPPEGPETAGHPAVYATSAGQTGDPFGEGNMIRERVSTRGLRRPLEPEEDLPGIHVPLDEVARIKELPAKRYLTGQTLWDKKFARTARRVERYRIKNLKRSHKEAAKSAQAWHDRIAQGDIELPKPVAGEEFLLRDGAGSQWNWALKGERPPPSAVAGRRDTSEAVKLAKIADQTDRGESKLGGLNLWTTAMDLLTRSSISGSGTRTPAQESHAGASASPTAASSPTSSAPPTRTSQHKASPLSAPASGYASDADGSDLDGRGPIAAKAQRSGSRFAVPGFMRRVSATRVDTAVDGGTEGPKMN